MGIGWHNESGAPNCKGKHREAEPSRGPGLPAAQAMTLEPEVDFDWDAVEDTEGEIMEAAPGVTRAQAQMIIGWITRRGHGESVGQARLLHRIMEWVADTHPEHGNGGGVGLANRRIGLRALTVIRALMPDSRIARTPLRTIAPAFGVGHEHLYKLGLSFKKSFGIK